MIVRLFSFKNTFLSDNPEPVDARYNIIGYFDGMDVSMMQLDADNLQNQIRYIGDPFGTKLIESSLKNSPEMNYDLYHIIGFHTETDNYFWSSSCPFTLITSLKFRVPPSDLLQSIREAEKDTNVLIYTTLDSSDVLICIHCSYIHQAYSKLLSIEYLFSGDGLAPNQGNFLKGYSHIAVSQSYIERIASSPETAEDADFVDVQFRANGKNQYHLETFRQALAHALDKPITELREYGIFGSDDYSILALEVSERKLLRLYARGGLLTHGNQNYTDAFFNVRTEILTNLSAFHAEAAEKSESPLNHSPSTTDTIDTTDTTANPEEKDFQKQINDLIMKLSIDPFKGKEAQLLYCCVCTKKLLWTFSKIERTDLLIYIYNIVHSSSDLFCEHFLSCAYDYLKEKNPAKRAKQLEDISDSVAAYWEVLDSIIQCSNLADRQVQQSAPIDTGLRYNPPKLCCYYSDLLNQLVALFNSAEGRPQYAFCVQPTLKSTAQCRILFQLRSEHGKIGLIRLPDWILSDVCNSNCILLHEYFHIIPGDMRLRRERATYYVKIVLYELTQELFAGIEFPAEAEVITKYLFNSVNELGLHDERDFYSYELKTKLANLLKNQLLGFAAMTLTDFFRLLSESSLKSSGQTLKAYEEMEDLYHCLQGKVLQLLSGNVIETLCNFYMNAFREIYADLMAAITLRLRPVDFYKSLNSISTQECAWYHRPMIDLRAYLVKEVLSREVDPELLCADPDNAGREISLDFFLSWQKTDSLKNTESIGNINETLRGIDIISSATYDQKDTHQLYSDTEGQFVVLRKQMSLRLYVEFFLLCRDQYLRHIMKNREAFLSFNRKFYIEDGIDNRDILHRISTCTWHRQPRTVFSENPGESGKN